MAPNYKGLTSADILSKEATQCLSGVERDSLFYEEVMQKTQEVAERSSDQRDFFYGVNQGMSIRNKPDGSLG